MRKIWSFSIVLASIVASLVQGMPAQAQVLTSRTWVSGVGDDTMNCSRTQPCLTFAGAIAKTLTGGEINCLDPGGFGLLTITKSVTIDCHEIFGSIMAGNGTTGIIINAAGAVVTLRNININGINSSNFPGTLGISILAAAKVQIENAMINGFTSQGIKDSRTGGGTQLIIKNTTVQNNTGPGIVAAAGAINAVVLENVHSVSNGFGVAVASGNNVVISRSVMSENTVAGIEADPGATVEVESTKITHNASYGIFSQGLVSLANSDVSFNNSSMAGSILSYGNNRIFSNGPGSAPSLIAQQ